MRFPPCVSLFLAIGLGAGFSSARAQQAPQVDPQTMLANLQQMRAKHDQAAHTATNQAIRDFFSASSTPQSAIAFYQGAVQVTQFDGADHGQTQMHDWKKKDEDLLRSPAFAISAQACLDYMGISMQRVAGATDQQIMPELMNYAQQVDAEIVTIYDQTLVKEPISDNIFAKWYGVGDQLAALENWTQEPQDTDAIYTKSILPWMRKNRDPRILQYWNAKIARAGTAASGGAEFNADVFNSTVKPGLLWSRAEDMVAIGMKDQGIAEMYSIIRSYPNQKDVGSWIDELEKLLAPPATTSTDGGAPPSPAQ